MDEGLKPLKPGIPEIIYGTAEPVPFVQGVFPQMRSESGCAVSGAANEPLNDEQQNQLKSNGPAQINPNIDGRTRPAGQKALMVLIETGHHQRAKNSQNRSAPP